MTMFMYNSMNFYWIPLTFFLNKQLENDLFVRLCPIIE